MTTKTDLVKVSDNERSLLAEVHDKYSGLAVKDMNPAEKALALSEATIALRDAFTPAIMSQIMSLMDKPYGFKTDRSPSSKEYKEKGPYPADAVKDVMVSAVLYGLHPTGNEFNIIAWNMYATKEAFTRKLKELPGLSDLQIKFGVPRMLNGGALVECSATWNYNGVPGSIGVNDGDKCEIPIRVNAMMGTDAILGKAERKIKKRIYDRITGTEHSIPEGDVGEVAAEVSARVVEDAKAKASSVAEKIAMSRQKQGLEPLHDIQDEAAGNPAQDDSEEQTSHVEENAEPPLDACKDYAELFKALTRQPHFMATALATAREKHDECLRVKEFCDIDHTNEIQCGLILTEFRRLSDRAKGK